MSVRRIVNLDNSDYHRTDPVVEPSSQPVQAVEVLDIDAPIAIPPNKLFGMDLKQIDGFRDIRIEMKKEQQLQEFVRGFRSVLKHFDTNQKHFDTKLVQIVCQNAEYFFVRPKSGDLKLKAVIEVVKIFFNNDAELVKTIVNLVLPLVKKCNMYRRYKGSIRSFFLPLLNILSLTYKPQV